MKLSQFRNDFKIALATFAFISYVPTCRNLILIAAAAHKPRTK